MSSETTIYFEAELRCAYTFIPADRGDPDVNSSTCCPPTPAHVEDLAVYWDSVDITAALSNHDFTVICEQIIESHND